ncbi:MRM2 [Candida metapsilosis]|uniref:rRNA methyltransferase 2, mitochondrial n=1 Tax=Candida metapsilosis TaxID=273372 RepID=A0A8H7ZH38_9ASCO|nr:MRM2 [Candida metapsilosis]
MLFTKQVRHGVSSLHLRVFSDVTHIHFAPLLTTIKWKSTATSHPPYKQFNKLKKLSRKEEAEQQGIASRNRLQYLDLKYGIITPSTKKILDVGFAPGHWMSYVIDRISQLHNVEDTKLHTVGVHILGFDILFKNPPLGTSSIQGNIFSKLSHENIVQHFQEIASKQNQLQFAHEVNDDINHKSYFAQEIDESQLAKKMEELTILDKSKQLEDNGKWIWSLVIWHVQGDNKVGFMIIRRQIRT